MNAIKQELMEQLIEQMTRIGDLMEKGYTEETKITVDLCDYICPE